jgi:hypothetical protein
VRITRGAWIAILGLAVAGCGGEPEPEYRWEEETVYEDRGPAPAPRRYGDDERSERPGDPGHYGRRPRDRGPRGAIYAPKRGVFCDEAVRACYTAKGGHPGVTEQQFGQEAGRRLARRIDDEGTRGARGIFRPDDGLLCDRLSEVCYDREGASLRETGREFGHEAAQDLSRRIDETRRGPGQRGGVIYSPRKGVSCDETVAVCYVEDSAHPGHTRQQFGDQALRDLERRMEGGRDRGDGIYRPDGGAICDRLSEVCYDRRGASAKLTRDEFGRDAAARMAERLE